VDTPSASAFRSWPLTAGGHRQTLLGYWLRRRLRWSLPSEDVVVEAGEDVRLLARATWQADRASRPTVVLVHGLGGCAEATYAVSTGLVAWERGYNVVRMNMRGAGDSEAICPRLYHAGLDTDLLAVLQAVAALGPRVALVGFSLGGNLVLLTLARQAHALPAGLFAAVAVSPSVDLAGCADALERASNRVYHRRYVRELRASYTRRQRRLPHLYEAGRENGLRSLRAFDDAITARYGGFRDVADYYARSSSGPLLTAIDRPTLILAAHDDPIIPSETVTRWPLPASGLVVREMHATGGHVGFVGPTRAPGRFWAAERAMDFLDTKAR